MTHAPGDELRRFQETVDQYLAGALAADAFKRCRLQFGIYGIRGLKDRQMVRVKLPSGRLTADQLDCLAGAAEEFATGRAHLTTRQDVQLYDVPIEGVVELLRRLSAAGLTTREACGNTVRNVTACPFTGLCRDELFDVSPYSLAVTRYFLRHPVCQDLPRKFKISFSGCAHDCAMAPVHDVGALAAAAGANRTRAFGFTLLVGGGLGAIPRAAVPLEPFTPATLLLPTIEAILRVFGAHGERKNRQRARLKFLIERLGAPAFLKLVLEERQRLLGGAQRYPELPAPEPLPPPAAAAPLPAVTSAATRRWLTTNVRAQRQPGYWTAVVRLPLGDMSARQMRGLAGIARWCARGELATTQYQDIALPWVDPERLAALHWALEGIGLAAPDAECVQDVTSCPGTDTCQIGLTSSRGLAAALSAMLDQPIYQTLDINRLRIKVSGCPNSCGQHHIADIGCYGIARTVGGRAMPHYQMLVGGRWSNGQVAFGQPVARLPAKRVPEAVALLLQAYRRDRIDGEPFGEFVRRVGLPALQALLQPLAEVEPLEAAPELYRDWGSDALFSLAGIGQGECAGG